MSYLLPNSRTGCMAFTAAASHPTVAPARPHLASGLSHPASPKNDHPAVFLSRENTIETTTSTVPSARNDTTR